MTCNKCNEPIKPSEIDEAINEDTHSFHRECYQGEMTKSATEDHLVESLKLQARIENLERTVRSLTQRLDALTQIEYATEYDGGTANQRLSDIRDTLYESRRYQDDLQASSDSEG